MFSRERLLSRVANLSGAALIACVVFYGGFVAWYVATGG